MIPPYSTRISSAKLANAREQNRSWHKMSHKGLPFFLADTRTERDPAYRRGLADCKDYGIEPVWAIASGGSVGRSTRNSSRCAQVIEKGASPCHFDLDLGICAVVP